MHSLLDVIEDTFGILRARIVARDDDSIREALRDLTHCRTLPAIAIATAAEDRDQLPTNERTHRGEGALERVGSMRIVAKHRRRFVEQLETSRHLRQAREALGNLRGMRTQRIRRGSGAEGVENVEIADERELDGKAFRPEREGPFAASRPEADRLGMDFGADDAFTEADPPTIGAELVPCFVIEVVDDRRVRQQIVE